MTENSNRPRKPCIALMGEFSAGKSTLANLLIGSTPLPVQVISTQLPPVLITHGDAAPFRVDLEGREFPVDLEDLSAAPLEDTAYINIFCNEDILLQCDLLDMPGISDPNMSADVWQRMITRADGVLWCSHATQAWRQSEAAVWASLSSELYLRSILLLTRIDKINSDHDRKKILRRVRAETKGLFRECLPISLLHATAHQEDYDLWLSSGAEDFVKHLVELLHLLATNHAHSNIDDNGLGPERQLRISGLKAPQNCEDLGSVPPSPQHEAPDRVVPRRVRMTSSKGRPQER